MSRWGTALLVVLALAAGGFLFFLEPRLTSPRERELIGGYAWDFDPAAVDEIRIVAGDDVVELSRRAAGGWRVGPVPRDRASAELVGELLVAARDLRVLDRVPANQLRGDLDADDFGVADAKLRLELIGQNETEVIQFGKEAAGEGRIYARVEGERDVLVVDDALVELAFQPARAFRDQRLTDLAVADIDAFIVKRAEGEISVRRTARGWEIERPLRARADARAVEAFLKPLLQAEIREFVADESNDLSAFGLTEPRAELILETADAKRPLALRVGSATENGEGVIAQFTERDSVYELPADLWEHLRVRPIDLRDRRVSDLNLDTIDRIVWQRNGEEDDWRRTETAWETGEGASLSEEEVAERVGFLLNATVREYLPATRANLAERGFDAPVGEVRFDAWLSENTPEAVAGRHLVHRIVVGQIVGDQSSIRVDEEPEILVVENLQLPDFTGRSGNHELDE